MIDLLLFILIKICITARRVSLYIDYVSHIWSILHQPWSSSEYTVTLQHAKKVHVRWGKGVRQWSFRGGTRGNAVPIVKIPLERMGTAFPLLSYAENANILLKMHFAVQKDVFLTLKYDKTRWRPELRPGPRWGSLRRSPDPLVGWGRGHPSPDPIRLSAFGASILAPSALNFGVPIVVNLRNDHWGKVGSTIVYRVHKYLNSAVLMMTSSFNKTL